MAENKTLMNEFAKFIKSKRLAMGISQAQLAERVYGNRAMKSYISAVESGKKDITMNSAGDILEALKSGIEFIE